MIDAVNRNEGGRFRLDIQGLRAIAVTMVLVYHLWPNALPGGYTGVDVFFVISGYLITSLLLRELDATGRINLPQFYVRRARRLLPAALMTLLAIVVATAVLLPVTQRESVAREVMAAALYFENWWLAAQAVDYLAMGEAPSPVQHFWSLSVEEQYYFVWPAALAGLYLLVRGLVGREAFRRGFMLFTALVILASLAYSIYSGLAGSTGSYFSSFTRIWQLAIGGLVAAMPAAEAKTGRSYLLAAGLAGILAAGLLLDSDTAYPGYAALLPTLATALAIFAGREYASSIATRWLGARPVDYLGDISYSLYLWHWPVIVFAKAWSGVDSLGLWGGLAALAISLALAALSKRYLEDVFRKSGGAPRPAWKALVPAALGSLACVGIGWGLVLATAGNGQPATMVANSAEYPGAAAMLKNGGLEIKDVPFLPALVNVNGDVASAYAERCIPNISGVDVQTCEYGNPDASVRIAVVGDSHAVHWFPAFQELARRLDIRIVGIAKNACMTSGLPVYNGALNRPYTECNTWTRNVIDYIKRHDFDYIVLSQSPGHYVDGRKDEGKIANARLIAAGMQKVWSELDGTNSKIVVFRSTPWQPTEVRDCVAGKTPPYDGCTATPGEALYDDAMSRLARLKGYPLIDFTDLFCTDTDCPAVIGNVFVYRDSHHITATYMRTLAPMVAGRMGIHAPPARQTHVSTNTVPTDLRPALASAPYDRGLAFEAGCVRSIKRINAKPCIYGQRHATVRIAVVGDATGANLMPGIDAAAKKHGWRIEGYFKDSCLFSRAPVIHRRLKRPYEECSRWNELVLERLVHEPPQLVILAESPQYTDRRSRSAIESAPNLANGITPLMRELVAAGSRVAVLRYLPWLPFNAPQCLQTGGDLSRCSAERRVSLRDGALLMAGRQQAGIAVIDLTEAFCDAAKCPPVEGDVLIYRDAFQPTATFARTLDGVLSERIEPLLPPAH